MTKKQYNLSLDQELMDEVQLYMKKVGVKLTPLVRSQLVKWLEIQKDLENQNDRN
jgi:hypothetical protein